jgi:hypothetical protein
MISGDHALWYPDEQRDKMCNAVGQLSALWSDDTNRDPALTELTLDYDKEKRETKWTGWMAPPTGPERQETLFCLSVLGVHLPGGGDFPFNLYVRKETGR